MPITLIKHNNTVIVKIGLEQQVTVARQTTSVGVLKLPVAAALRTYRPHVRTIARTEHNNTVIVIIGHEQQVTVARQTTSVGVLKLPVANALRTNRPHERTIARTDRTTQYGDCNNRTRTAGHSRSTNNIRRGS